MKVLVIGSGGREHALVWKLAQSSKVSQIYCAPGNDGIAKMAELVPLAVENIDGLLHWARTEGIDLTVVGPEVPLTLGIVDRFMEAGLRIFGPCQAAAQIEGSKAFAKNLMQTYGIPTADYRVFTDPWAAKKYIQEKGVPLVIKADGLAAGKGVVVAQDLATALEAIEQMMEKREFGEAGGQIVVEEFLQGPELSLLALIDGKTIVPLAPAHDHKAVFDGDEGPNTGGMGAFSPSHIADDSLIERIVTDILQPTIDGLSREGIEYRGVLFAGLMLTEDGPKVLEFNARFGDPETQVVLPRLENDLVDVMEAVIDGRLAELDFKWKKERAVTVILASGGYPGPYEKGKWITGLNEAGQLDNIDECLRSGIEVITSKIKACQDDLDNAIHVSHVNVSRLEDGEPTNDNIIIFHAGTKYSDAHWQTNGGRVLAVTALGEDFAQARERVYDAVARIEFVGQHCRKDIGLKAVRVQQ